MGAARGGSAKAIDGHLQLSPGDTRNSRVAVYQLERLRHEADGSRASIRRHRFDSRFQICVTYGHRLQSHSFKKGIGGLTTLVSSASRYLSATIDSIDVGSYCFVVAVPNLGLGSRKSTQPLVRSPESSAHFRTSPRLRLYPLGMQNSGEAPRLHWLSAL